MSWRCDLTGKGPLVGHKVSHSNIKTKRRFLPNLQNVTLTSDTLGRSVRVRISTNALKTVDHRGGLDAFLLKAKDAELSKRALDLKRQVVKKRAAATSFRARQHPRTTLDRRWRKSILRDEARRFHDRTPLHDVRLVAGGKYLRRFERRFIAELRQRLGILGRLGCGCDRAAERAHLVGRHARRRDDGERGSA